MLIYYFTINLTSIDYNLGLIYIMKLAIFFHSSDTFWRINWKVHPHRKAMKEPFFRGQDALKLMFGIHPTAQWFIMAIRWQVNQILSIFCTQSKRMPSLNQSKYLEFFDPAICIDVSCEFRLEWSPLNRKQNSLVISWGRNQIFSLRSVGK